MMPPRCTNLVLAWSTAVCTGCSATARLDLHQPHLTGRQQHLSLQSMWAEFAHDHSQRARILLAFPLPGARCGDKHYYLYIRCPSITGRYELSDQKTGGLTGFFLQVRGKHAGMTKFEQGTLEISGGERQCQGRFTFSCEDQTELEGSFTAERDEWSLLQFEEQRLDIAD